MNRITKIGSANYHLECENGEIIPILKAASYDKRNGGHYWLKLPENNPTKRKYVETTRMEKGFVEYIEFESEETERVVTISSWKNYLTEEEKSQIAEYESKIKDIEEQAKARAEKMKNDPKMKAINDLKKQIQILKNLNMDTTVLEDALKELIG